MYFFFCSAGMEPRALSTLGKHFTVKLLHKTIKIHFKKTVVGDEEMAQQLKVLLSLRGTQVWFLAHTCSSQLPVTLVIVNPIPFLILMRARHAHSSLTSIHPYIHPSIHPYILTYKVKINPK